MKKNNNNANTTHMNNGSPSTPQHHHPRSRSKKQLPSDTDLFYIDSSFPIFGHTKNSTTFSISISVTNSLCLLSLLLLPFAFSLLSKASLTFGGLVVHFGVSLFAVPVAL
jgi:hypothetical protein